ncbi:uncharacterized protein LOC116306777 [Actinia tenebrosa]|uniref:Uncharacterized protein LOC116306777 n=1 Tax=Actinia tenebrosa TaxID=6105 RepID=A0A6P8IZU1_ACTTE|nr:uncharacterized protein LOC116306777 [Actinia tenebrosa]
MKTPQRNRWCNLIKRQHGRVGFAVSNFTFICEKHFKPQEIYKPPGGTRRRLKTGVEPTIFKWQSNSPKTKRRSPRRRLETELKAVPLKPTTTERFTANNDQECQVATMFDQHIAIGTSEDTMECFDNIEYYEYTQVPAFKEEIAVQTHLSNTEDKAVQTDESDHTESTTSIDHSYSFPFCTAKTYAEQKGYVRRLEAKIEDQTNIINQLRCDIGNLQKKLNGYDEHKFSLEKYKDDNSAIQFYTGFPNFEALISVFDYLEPKVNKLQYWGSKKISESRAYQQDGKQKPGPKRNLTAFEGFSMVLVRLKIGLFVRDLSDRFGISQGHFSKIFSTWVNFLFLELRQLFPFPTQANVFKNMPVQFSRYPKTRVIIDCTEVFVEVPSAMQAQSETWSNYKHHNTFKVLVCISPNGQVTFLSKLWGGRVSDKCITQNSGLLELLDKGDNVMADRGFDIADILPPGVSLNLPPFKGTRDQLTASEVEETARIAAVRIHVERAIGRIKNYHILDGTLPISLAHVANQIFSVCAYLTNFLPPLLPPGKKD